MAKEKNKPVPVRFNLKLLETLKEEEKIDTPQQALNFLTNFWENNRPAKGDFLGAGVQPGAAASAAVPGFEAGSAPGEATASAIGLAAGAGIGAAAGTAPGAATVAAKKKTGQKKEGASAEPPPGLSGIDLSIWKAEQREKNKS